jgi:hypothetical protein
MSEYIHHEETDEATGLTLKIVNDSDPMNPRTEFDEACVMVCDHGRYDLGDKDGHDEARDAIRASRFYEEKWEEDEWQDEDGNWQEGEGLDFNHGPDLYAAIQRCHDIVIRCLFLYDHSGITMSTSPFNCPWDSGMVGFAFMDEERMKKNFMVEEVTDDIRARTRKLIDGEVKQYDQYLTGDVWGYVIEDREGEQVDSCWGFYGADYCEEEGKSIFASLVEEQKQDDSFMEKIGVPAIPGA